MYGVTDAIEDKNHDKQVLKEKEIVLLYHDSTPCHNSMTTMSKLHELNFDLLSYLPHFADLTLSDYN